MILYDIYVRYDQIMMFFFNVHPPQRIRTSIRFELGLPGLAAPAPSQAPNLKLNVGEKKKKHVQKEHGQEGFHMVSWCLMDV